MKIVGFITKGTELSKLIIFASSAHIRKVNFMVAKRDPSNMTYEYMLSFSSSEVKRLSRPHDDTLVISLNVANVLLKKILVNLGSLVNLPFLMALIDIELQDLTTNLVTSIC